MRILVLNCGSSSVKLRLFEAEADGRPGAGVARGAARGIGGRVALELAAGAGEPARAEREGADHAQAVGWLLARLDERAGGRSSVGAVGHRVVHGGERFVAPTPLGPAVESELDALAELAPLHNPACLAGIRAARAHYGADLPMVAVFDTAFHRTLPPAARHYALPLELARRHGIRRYGFHGLAHASLAAGWAEAAERPLAGSRLVTLQLGNGCSAAALADGRSVETSMGYTPLEGLVMGTRSGDLDPAVVARLAAGEGVEADAVEAWLNERSGLLGVSGLGSDMRTLLEAEARGDERAALAIELFCYRARKYVGAYLAVLGGADALVFGGGIGEHAPAIRARIGESFAWCGLRLDPARNAAAGGLEPGAAAPLHARDSAMQAWVVAVDEERAIARDALSCL